MEILFYFIIASVFVSGLAVGISVSVLVDNWINWPSEEET